MDSECFQGHSKAVEGKQRRFSLHKYRFIDFVMEYVFKVISWISDQLENRWSEYDDFILVEFLTSDLVGMDHPHISTP